MSIMLSHAFLLSIPVISLIVGILGIWGRSPGIRRQRDFMLFGAGWVSLVIAGINCRDITLIVITFPLVAISLVVCALLWRATASAWSKAAAFCYWIGGLSIIAGAVYFGGIAYDLQCIERNCHGAYNPPQPNIVRDLVFWSLPALIVCLGLRLSKQFGGIGIAVAGTLLLILNPTILWMVAWLQPSLGM